MLFEAGVIKNRDEELALMDPARRTRMADGIATGILACLSVEPLSAAKAPEANPDFARVSTAGIARGTACKLRGAKPASGRDGTPQSVRLRQPTIGRASAPRRPGGGRIGVFPLLVRDRGGSAPAGLAPVWKTGRRIRRSQLRMSACGHRLRCFSASGGIRPAVGKRRAGPRDSAKDSCAMYHGEKLNAWTHLVGAVLALVGSVVLIVRAALGGDPWKVVSVSIYGLTLVLLYSFSTSTTACAGAPRSSCASSTTTASTCSSPAAIPRSAWSPCAAPGAGRCSAWCRVGAGGAGQPAGAVAEGRRANPLGGDLRADGLGRPAALFPLLDALGTSGFAWVAAGGVLYTVGIVFYALDTRMTHAHGIWHLFVLAGSAAHYFAILRYVL